MTAETPSSETLIERFLEMLSAERNAAANTRAAYQRDLQDAAKFVAARKVELGDMASADLSAYLAAMAKKGLAARSSARRLSALRQFFNSWSPSSCAATTRLPRSTGRSSGVRCRSCWTKTR